MLQHFFVVNDVIMISIEHVIRDRNSLGANPTAL